MPLQPPSQLLPYFKPPSEAHELEAIQALRAKVAALSAEMRQELGGLLGPTPGVPGLGLAPAGSLPAPGAGLPGVAAPGAMGVHPQMGMAPQGVHAMSLG